MPFPYPTPLGWGAENAGKIGGCSEGGNFLPLASACQYHRRCEDSGYVRVGMGKF